MTDSNELDPIRIGDFVFRPSTGEVRRAGSRDSPPVRLPPQPTRLLGLLAAKQGELVTREEIRELLWPDTHVDFDQSVSFCIRQIRNALGDSAEASDYIETLPRRGYRLRFPEESTPDSDAAPTTPPPRSGARFGRLALGVLAVAIAALVGWRATRSAPPEGPPRLAIMPFELAGEGATETDLARTSEWLLAELTQRYQGRLEVIGPRSTVTYSRLPFPHMRGLIRDLEADFVVNARFFEREGRIDLIVELIDLDDGAHPWADYFSDVDDWQGIAEATLANVVAALELPEE